jgi:hypothetical protein
MTKQAQKATEFTARATLSKVHYPYIAKECISAYLDNVGLALETTRNLWDSFEEMHKELQRNCPRIFSSEAKMAEKAVGSQSWNEFSSIQAKAAQKWIDNYFSETQKLYTLFRKNCFKAVNQSDLVKSQLVVE